MTLDHCYWLTSKVSWYKCLRSIPATVRWQDLSSVFCSENKITKLFSRFDWIVLSNSTIMHWAHLSPFLSFSPLTDSQLATLPVKFCFTLGLGPPSAQPQACYQCCIVKEVVLGFYQQINNLAKTHSRQYLTLTDSQLTNSAFFLVRKVIYNQSSNYLYTLSTLKNRYTSETQWKQRR